MTVPPPAPDREPKNRWRSRPLGEDGSMRGVIADHMSRRAGFEHIPPAIWATAGSLAKALTAAGFRKMRVSPPPAKLGPNADDS